MVEALYISNPSLNDGYPIRLLSGELTYNWKNLTVSNPINVGFDIPQSQFSGWEAPKINVSFYIPINSDSLQTSDYMTWSLWNDFVKSQYLGTSSTRTVLTLIVGNTSTSLLSYAQSSVGNDKIPIQIDGFTLRISKSEGLGRAWIINAQFTETK